MSSIEDRNKAARAAVFAVGSFAIDNRVELGRLPKAVHDRLIVEVALGYLFGHGLVQLTEWPEWLPVEAPEEMIPDIRAAAEANRAVRDALFPNGLPS